MKRLYPSIFLAAIVISAIAATVKISDLPISTSPSTNTFLEIADMDAVTKSGKYLLTNLVTQSAFTSATNSITTSAANWTASGTTNSTLTGVARANGGTFTNGITAGASTFTGTLTALPSVANTQPVIMRGGTVTADTPILEMSETWNNAGVTFTGLKLNITNTASASASLLMDLQVGGTSALKVDKSSNLTLGGNGRFLTPNAVNQNTPSVSSAADLTSGINFRGITSEIGFVTSGSIGYSINSEGLIAAAGKPFGFSSTAAGGGWFAAADTLLYRDAANTLQLGADAASPSAQAFKAADGSGTDKTGANLTIEGGQGTGTGAGGSVILRTALTGASSASSVNAYQDRARYPAKFITLTDNTVTSLFTVTLPATNSVGISWTCTIMAGNATDFQSLTTAGTIDGVAKTTTITTVGTPTAAQTALAGSAGTLSVTYTFVDLGSNVMALRVTADTDLASLAYLRAKVELTGIACHGAGVVINEL